MASWDRPNSFTFHDNLDSHTAQRNSYFFTFKFYQSMEDAENKQNPITTNVSSFTNSYGKLNFHLTMGDYYIEWNIFFMRIRFYSTGSPRGYLNAIDYTTIHHLSSGKTIYDYFADGGVNVIHDDYINCYISQSALNNYRNISSVSKTEFGIYGNTIYY